MVFKPLGVAADGLRAVGSLLVDVLHQSLPRAFQPQGVAVDFDETVDEVHLAVEALQPGDAVLVEDAQVTSLVVADEEFYDVTLLFVLGYRGGLAEPVDNVADSVGIEPVGLPHLLLYLSVGFHEC